MRKELIKKSARFLRKPFNKKLQIVKGLLKRIITKALRLVIKKPISYLFSTPNGRDLLYDTLPQNLLLLNQTSDDILYVTNSSDKSIGRSVFIHKKSYDANHLVKSFEILKIDKKAVILDVGAHIGTIGIYAILKNYAEKCIAFEPEPRNFDLLKKNIALNSLDKHFEIHNLALSDNTSDTVTFELSGTGSADHRIRVKEENGLFNEGDREVINVRTTTLDKILKAEDYSDCILFMDTQGFEGYILKGAKTLISKGVPIVTEFWPYGMERTNGMDKFISALNAGNYTKIYDLDHPETPMNFSAQALKKLAEDIGTDGKYTNLLITK